MKTVCIALCVVAASAAFTELSVDAKFESFKAEHGKTYATADAEAAAKAAFVANDAIINEHNAKGLSYWLGHNEFSDLTWEQFKALYVGKFSENPTLNRERNFDYSLLNETVTADAVDWTTKGAVTPVKNQAQCGSCWAFSTTGSVEGAFQIAGNPLTSLSEQELVSCDNAAHGGSDQGCNGGLMDNAFKWISKNGLCTESDYPYTSGHGQTGTCQTTCQKVVTVTGYTDVPGESGMLAAISKGPVSVAIEADKSAFQLYKGGVLDNAACGKKLDHGVLAVGFGTDSGKDYYKVKNSWGATWGESGYIRMVQGKDQCGIADSASYPTGAKKMGPGPKPGPGPSPGPGPAPGPSPTGTHYGDPKNGCLADEEAVQVQGVAGGFCSPSCTGFIVKNKCPTDEPAGATATPQCVLQDQSTGKKNCGLVCSPSAVIKDQKAADAQCGTNASCKSIQTVGLCTYDD